jgi:A/G-specific adenine glycosylase
MPGHAVSKNHSSLELTGQLLDWMKSNLRDLPWRLTRDPWEILVAECMLQQTQVARVIPKWHAFIHDFPTPAACASAPIAQILRHWDGLGYNRRAIQLHGLAIAVVNDHGGVVPEGLHDLLGLPGIGPYTARAIRVFAYEHDDAVVDTNVGRIVARAVVGRTVTAKTVQEIADQLVPPGSGWLWNQGILDFGATICTKKVPKCSECPISTLCRWRSGLAVGERSIGEQSLDKSSDPAIGSAAVGAPQSRFEGSDRQGRGRLLRALHKSDVAAVDLEHVMGWPGEAERAAHVAETLVADGLASWNGTAISLPKETSISATH